VCFQVNKKKKTERTKKQHAKFFGAKKGKKKQRETGSRCFSGEKGRNAQKNKREARGCGQQGNGGLIFPEKWPKIPS